MKSWWMSKTVLGGLAAIFAGAFGIGVDEINALITNGVAIAGGILAIVGRVKAKGIIKF